LKRHDVPSAGGKFCWRPPCPGHQGALFYANIAWVFERDDNLGEAIRYVIWDATDQSDGNTALEKELEPRGKDVKSMRSENMKSVLKIMCGHLVDLLKSDTTNNAHAKAITRKVQNCPALGIDLVRDADHNVSELSKKPKPYSVYDLIYQIDLALLGLDPADVSARFGTSRSSSSATSGSSLSGSNNAVDGNAITHEVKAMRGLNWKGFGRMAKKVASGSGQQLAAEVKKMLQAVDTQIRRDQDSLVQQLVDERRKAQQRWSTEQYRSDPNPGSPSTGTPVPNTTAASSHRINGGLA